MKSKRRLYLVLSCIIGGMSRILLLGVLRSFCILNVPFYMDNLWVKPIGEGLVKNLIGAIAFRMEGCGCDDKLIFVAPYHSSSGDDQVEMKSLSAVVDIATWRKIESDTISTTYIDKTNKYVLFQNSDGVNLKVFKQ